jgi:hypothetical protein
MRTLYEKLQEKCVLFPIVPLIEVALFALFALLLFAWPAFAVDTTKYPSTLMDNTCTDTEDTIGEFVFGNQYVQVTGSADLLCDHDSRIYKSAVADVTWGPFNLKPGSIGILLYVDADAVSNNTDTWRTDILIYSPHGEANISWANTTEASTEGDKTYSYANMKFATTIGGSTEAIDVAFPVGEFYIQLNVNSATTWAGGISWIEF